ncbi:Putative aminoacrylate peracid reductase RutC [Cupriavidus laharis]|uniref:Aminoacrylate peracid reductase RutC n=1 Tax=Cupriavidus laharis TaxID=151654 RepID=A0ABN7YG63_9BURK|nr:RidA family protein [Cupriavidus laharis]CAG9172385.1 Putative aminoacrylate peracid reductase RutC [Cupriavidus laharis]
MSSNELKRAHVGKRLSEYAVYNGVVYLAGQVPEVDPKADIHGQTREVLGHIDRLLAEADSDKTRILSCQIFLTDIGLIGAMNEVWDAWVPQGNTPPRATVEARLANPDYLIEVVVTAALN